LEKREEKKKRKVRKKKVKKNEKVKNKNELWITIIIHNALGVGK
jgi:hypothetical protein